MSLKDIKRIFLVGGSSRLKMIFNSWSQIKSISGGEYSYDIQYADIEVVAIGAAKYNHLRVSSDRFIELGIIRIYKKDYNTAALYFRNANTSSGNYLLGVLYHEGLIGSKRNYRRAIQYFKLSDNEQSNAMLAKCAFQGKQGLPRDHSIAKIFLQKSRNLDLAKKIENAISSSSPTQEVLEWIYNFDPVSDILSGFDIDKLDHKYSSDTKTSKATDTSSINHSEFNNVKPCSPELKYSD